MQNREMTFGQLRLLWSDCRYVFIDIRPKREYDQWHLPNTISIPEHELMLNYEKLDKSKTYIIICQRGQNSRDVVHYLNLHGFKAYNLSGGLEGIPR